MKTFQVCKKLSKIVKISTKFSKKVNEIQNHFSKKLEKTICSKTKFIKKLNVLTTIFSFFFKFAMFFILLSIIVRCSFSTKFN